MGTLAEIQLPTEDVTIPGPKPQSFQVRGLAFGDVATLMRVYGDELSDVFGETVFGADEDGGAIETIAKTLLTVAPSAVAEIIALAADAPELGEIAAGLPAPVQIDALIKIAGLTFESEEQAGELLETVITSSEVVTRLVTKLTGSENPS